MATGLDADRGLTLNVSPCSNPRTTGGGALAPPLVTWGPHPLATADVVLGGLPGFVGSAARHGLFQCQLADRQHRLSVDVVQLLADLHPVRIRNHHFANGDHGRVGHRHRRRDRPAVRLLHRQDRFATFAPGVSRARLPAAVGQLPRPGVRVDQHPLEPRRIAKY